MQLTKIQDVNKSTIQHFVDGEECSHNEYYDALKRIELQGKQQNSFLTTHLGGEVYRHTSQI